jgi:hypothetical protein
MSTWTTVQTSSSSSSSSSTTTTTTTTTTLLLLLNTPRKCPFLPTAHRLDREARSCQTHTHGYAPPGK